MDDHPEHVWRALSDPVRRTILDLLRGGPQTTGALSARFEQTRFGVMKHLKVLEAAGLVLVERRGRERWNYLNAAALREAIERWMTPFQRDWTVRLGALDLQLEQGETPMTMPDGYGMDIRLETRLGAAPARVFDALTRDVGQWWRAPYRQAGPTSTLSLEAKIGAPLLETGADGHAAIWGRIEEIRVPDRLYLAGRFAVAGAVAGRVHFDLEPHGEQTLLRLTHTALGPIAAETRRSFEAGWRDLLCARLAEYLMPATV